MTTIVDYLSAFFQRLLAWNQFYLLSFGVESANSICNWLICWQMIGIMLIGGVTGILVWAHVAAEGKRRSSVFLQIAVRMVIASGFVIILYLGERAYYQKISLQIMVKNRDFVLYCLIPLVFSWLIALMLGLCSSVFLSFQKFHKYGKEKKKVRSRLSALIVLSFLLIIALGNHYGLWIPKVIIMRYEHIPVLMREDKPEVYLLDRNKDVPQFRLAVGTPATSLSQSVTIYAEMSVHSEPLGYLYAGENWEQDRFSPTKYRGWRYDQETGGFAKTVDIWKAVSKQDTLFSLCGMHINLDLVFGEYDFYGIMPEVRRENNLRRKLFVSPDLSFIMPTLDLFVLFSSLLLLAADAWHSRRKKVRRLSRDLQPGKEAEN